MQSNHYLTTIKKVYPKLFQVLKYPLAVACLWYTFVKVKEQNLDFSLRDLDMPVIVLIVVFSLMFINWLLEAWRWQMSLPFESISFVDAVNDVLRGLALNAIIPFTLGDVGGRIVGRVHKSQSMLAMGLNRIIILLITIIYGGAGVIFFMKLSVWPISFFGVVLLAILFLATSRKSLFGISLIFFDKPLAFQIASITIVRYFVFTMQFYLLLASFNPSLSALVIFLGIGWVFLFRSVVPSLLGNIGVREASAVIFFQPYVENLQTVIVPCLIIWIINTIIPSLAGTVVILKSANR